MISGLVSVVVCAFNNWPDLEMTIASALQQSYQPIEVIVVDNSSTDATPHEVPKRFGGNVRYIRQPNRECAGAHNTGFALASGEFIQFVAGDDVLAPNKIEKQVEVFQANPDLDIVYGNIRSFQTSDGMADWIDTITEPEADMLRRLSAPDSKWSRINVLGALFRRKVMPQVGPWDESLYIEDLDYWLRAAWAGCRFGHCPGSVMGFRRIHHNQKTSNVSALALGAERVWDKALGYVNREPYRSLVAAALARRRFEIAVFRYRLSQREALAKLSLARATSPRTITRLSYALGCATVILPGGTALVRSRWLLPLRRVLSRLLKFRVSR